MEIIETLVLARFIRFFALESEFGRMIVLLWIGFKDGHLHLHRGTSQASTGCLFWTWVLRRIYPHTRQIWKRSRTVSKRRWTMRCRTTLNPAPMLSQGCLMCVDTSLQPSATTWHAYKRVFQTGEWQDALSHKTWSKLGHSISCLHFFLNTCNFEDKSLISYSN